MPGDTVIKRSFTDAIEALRYGTLADELDKKLRELVLACDEAGKSGALTLVIKIKPSKSGPLEVSDDIKMTMPKPDKGSSLMYVTPEGHLQRNDPRQSDLPGLRAVDKETAEIRAVAKA